MLIMMNEADYPRGDCWKGRYVWFGRIGLEPWDWECLVCGCYHPYEITECARCGEKAILCHYSPEVEAIKFPMPPCLEAA